MAGIDPFAASADVLPTDLVAKLVELAEDASGGPAGLYVVDIEGTHLLGLLVPAGFPSEVEIRSGLGPEIAEAGVAEARAAFAAQMPGSAVAPLWWRGRATAALVAAQDPHARLEGLALAAAAAFELAGGYTDVVDRARRTRRTSAAAEVQQDLLAPRMARVAGGEVAGSLLPAYEVGGDWFDHADNPEGAWLAVADAMGKGARAGALSALALAALRGARRSGDGLEECCQAIHDEVQALGGSDIRFVTAVIATWHAPSATLTWVCCGHPAPLLVGADGAIEELASERTLPLGLVEAEPRTFQRMQRRLAPGDRVLLYSDGITERRTGAGRFGFDGLTRAVGAADDDSAAAMVKAVEHAVLGASEDPIADDATQLVLRVR